MRHALKNTISVVATTAVTALIVFASVQLSAGSISGDYSTASAGSSSGSTQTCPRTGCSASSCHATEGLSPQQAYGSTAGSSNGFGGGFRGHGGPGFGG